MSTRSRQRSHNVLNMPAVDSMTAVATGGPADVSRDDVARRAFELYCARDREDGHDVDDWLQAERELTGSATTTAA